MENQESVYQDAQLSASITAYKVNTLLQSIHFFELKTNVNKFGGESSRLTALGLIFA